jgi:hypothetical protein
MGLLCTKRESIEFASTIVFFFCLKFDQKIKILTVSLFIFQNEATCILSFIYSFGVFWRGCRPESKLEQTQA